MTKKSRLRREYVYKIEMTLDRSVSFAIKGHFCSLLVSNIFCDPLFLLSPLSLSPT